MKTLRKIYTLACLMILSMASCTQVVQQSPQYGYVQFHLISSSLSGWENNTKAEAQRLENLTDAAKIKVVLLHEGSTITQTLPLSGGEFGLRSEKLSLLAGEYNIVGFYLYDRLDNLMMSCEAGEDPLLSVPAGGLTVKRLEVEAVARGRIKFHLVKNIASTKAENGAEYPFSTIRRVSLTLRNCFTREEISLSKLKVSHINIYEGGIRSTEAVCDSTIRLPEGNYSIVNYSTYSDNAGRNLLETSTPEAETIFTVDAAEALSRIDVPIKLCESADYIKDYAALRAIWEDLDGPSWSYFGQEYAKGTNWNFDKSIDLWGEQPGVSLDDRGRISSLDLSCFGAKGKVPDEIGYLTALQILYLGHHNETSDIAPGATTNGISGISRAIMRLENLQQLYIANSPITTEGFFIDISEDSPFFGEKLDWANLQTLTDIEIYNCQKLSGLPLDMLCGLPDIQLLCLTRCTGIPSDRLRSDWEAIIDGASGSRIQILYLNYTNLRETPSYEKLSNMVKLGFIDLSHCSLEKVHPFGAKVTPATVALDYNNLREIPAAEDGCFVGYEQLESFSVSHNCLEKVPDIFNARSIYEFDSVDFSYNNISEFEHGTAHRGINAKTINLSYNAFSSFPAQIFKSGSPCEYLLCAGNGMKEIPAGSLMGPKSHRLMSIDLSYNRLRELPGSDFYASNLPYLYGVDLSYNAFDYFPTEVLDSDSVTVLALRHQRDDEGNRTLKSWPSGLYRNCPSLQALYLGSNDIRKVDDTVTPQIPILEISDNPNISITLASSACSYIEAGYMLFIYDKSQDIRGCPSIMQ